MTITKKEKKSVVEFFIKLNEFTNNNNDIASKVIKVLREVK